MARQDADEPKLKVFVSYSRKDLVTVDCLERQLKSRAIETLIDRSDIEKFEDWWERIAALIGQADTVIFVLSPDALESEVAQREVDYAASLNKRFAPVVIKDVPADRVPKALAKLNYVYLRATDDAELAFEDLVAGLITDIDWVREHTRIGELARRWHGAQRRAPEGVEALLLRGLELADAELWISRRPREAPEPTDLHRTFIQDSRKGEQARAQREAEQLAARERAQGRARVALGCLFALAILTAVWAAWQSRETAKREAKIMTSLAHKAASEGYYDRAMRIALQGLPPPGALPFAFRSEEVEAVLSGAAMLSRLKVQLAHQGWVFAAGFSPDGRRVVTASADETARIWDVSSGQLIAVLTGHTSAVRSAAFSPDGRHIVTASRDETARLWDAGSGKELAVLRGHQEAVDGAAFSPDGSMIVTASYDRTARVWDGATGEERRALVGHNHKVWSAAFSPDGRQIVTASEDKTARLWDTASFEVIGILKGHSDLVRSAAFSSDGRRIVTASFDKTARLWSAETGAEIAILRGHTDRVWAAAFSPDGRRILTASEDKTARLWDADSGEQITVMNGHGAALRSVAISPDGRQAVTASTGSTVRIWEVKTGKETVVLNGHGNDVYSAVFSPDGKQIVTASHDGYARVWNTENAALLAILRGHARGLRSVEFTADGERVVSVSDDGDARQWDAKSGNRLGAPEQTRQQSSHTWSSPDGRRVVRADPDPGMPAQLFDSAGAVLAKLRGHEGRLLNAAFSPDGRHIVTASADDTARVWDAADGKALVVLKGHRKHIWSATFSPDGRLVATASQDGTARLWHAASGSEIAILSGHDRGVRGVAFSPDGRRLVTGSDDRTVRLWDVAWVTQMVGPALRDHVCREKLIGAQAITDADADDPILSAVKRINVCERRRLLSPGYWSNAARDLWAWAIRGPDTDAP